MLEPGDTAPQFNLPNHAGETVELADLLQGPLVLYFYPKAHSEGCTIQACNYRDNWEAFRAAGLRVVGISTDEVEEIRAFKDEEALPFMLLSDKDGSVARDYESYGIPEIEGEQCQIARRNTYVIDQDGIITHVYEDVSPERNADEIINDIRGN